MGPRSQACPLCGATARWCMTLPHTSVYRCDSRDCELQFAAPQLGDEKLAEAYTSLYFQADGSSATLHTKPESDARYFLERVGQRLGPSAGRRILDYGCGHGMLLRVARQLGAQATGIEQSEAARRRIAQSGAGVAYADVAELRRREPNTRFDWITMVEVIEHLRRPWEDLRQLSELLADGGRIIIVTPNAESLRSRLHGARWDQRLNLTHFYYFTTRSLAAVLGRAGLKAQPMPPIEFYSKQNRLQRQLQPILRSVGMQGDLVFSAAAAAPVALSSPSTAHSHA